MNVRHHVSDELLVSYEAGSLAEGWSLAVATHLALCPTCRRRAAMAAAVGGALLESIDAVDVAPTSFDAVMAKIAGAEPVVNGSPEHPGERPLILPQPLRSYVGGDVDAIRWRRLGMSARHFPIATGDGQTSVRLLFIPAGEPVPEHGHRGPELTVVVDGSLVDGADVFRRGDIEEADENVKHQPSAGSETDCICLAVTDAPLKFDSLLVRLAQPFLGI
jgi:putative transcriptional regulator